MLISVLSSSQPMIKLMSLSPIRRKSLGLVLFYCLSFIPTSTSLLQSFIMLGNVYYDFSLLVAVCKLRSPPPNSAQKSPSPRKSLWHCFPIPITTGHCHLLKYLCTLCMFLSLALNLDVLWLCLFHLSRANFPVSQTGPAISSDSRTQIPHSRCVINVCSRWIHLNSHKGPSPLYIGREGLLNGRKPRFCLILWSLWIWITLVP